ncbi:3-oxoacyl- reductase [Penicillium frequentans]|uniref:3-oxoacyl- reductase n=1 Tax=Penicillium frequentans TaxID=3151616 RepID=A0AAD6D1I7_9EURO|nr:3-oxoacyl- reductase [Penicillium glabrum]
MESPNLSLRGKVALVSGSSSGIGAAIARELSARGAAVIVNYPYPSEASTALEVLESLAGDAKSKSIIVEADLATINGPKQLSAAAAAHFEKIDILVNNAGYSGICIISDSSNVEIEDAWEKTINLNGRGTVLLTHAILPLLAPIGSRIINIGSSTSRDPDPDMSIYAGSKGMIESFTRCWARDLPRKHGCTVNTVAPGPVATGTLLAAPGALLDLLRSRLDRVPVESRFAHPEEVAWVVAELCEAKAAWLNGLYLPVTGGLPLC